MSTLWCKQRLRLSRKKLTKLYFTVNRIDPLPLRALPIAYPHFKCYSFFCSFLGGKNFNLVIEFVEKIVPDIVEGEPVVDIGLTGL